MTFIACSSSNTMVIKRIPSDYLPQCEQTPRSLCHFCFVQLCIRQTAATPKTEKWTDFIVTFIIAIFMCSSHIIHNSSTFSFFYRVICSSLSLCLSHTFRFLFCLLSKRTHSEWSLAFLQDKFVWNTKDDDNGHISLRKQKKKTMEIRCLFQ